MCKNRTKLLPPSELLLLGTLNLISKHVGYYAIPGKNSILLHSGLNPARHFWLSTRFSCCLKMKSLENIFTDFQDAVSLEKIFEIVEENTRKCSKLIRI